MEPCLYGRPILVLNSDNDAALIVDSTGRRDELTCFTRDSGISAYKACGITWQNSFYIFGGQSSNRAISELSGTQLKKIGSLSINFEYGACATMNDQKIFLCFHYYGNGKQCWTGISVLGEFVQIDQSNHAHKRTRISSSHSKLKSVTVSKYFSAYTRSRSWEQDRS